MGKYMKKKSEVAVVVEGVRTRAKTLALQRRLNNSLGGGVVVVDESSFCYLQLRSRRLEKSSPLPSKQKQQQNRDREKASCRAGDNGGNQNQDKGSSSFKELENVASNEVGAPEASPGDNIIADFEPRDRSTRESTPCSFTRGCSTIRAPDSTTRRTASPATNQGVQSDVQRIMPTANEIEEFFASVEKQQRRLFIEKYNFDIVNDLPLPGHYRWVQVVP